MLLNLASNRRFSTAGKAVFELDSVLADYFGVGFLTFRTHDEVVYVGFYLLVNTSGIKLSLEYYSVSFNLSETCELLHKEFSEMFNRSA